MKNDRKKKGLVLALLMLFMGMLAFAQNVILLIPDGMSVAGTTPGQIL